MMTIHFIILAVVQSKPWNILAIDGGGIRGVIPAIVLDHMETYAWDYAVNKKGYQVRDFFN